MPRGNMIKKYLEELTQYLNGIELSEEYAEYLDEIAALSELFDMHYTKDAKGHYKPLSEEQMEELRNSFNYVLMAGSTFLKAAENVRGNGDRTLNTRKTLVKNFEEHLLMYMNALSGAVGTEGMTLPQIMESVSGREIAVESEEIHTVGGAMSNRIPLAFRSESGKEVSGFFTAYTKFDMRKECKAVVKEISGGNKMLETILNTLSSDAELMTGLFRSGEVEILKQIQKMKGHDGFAFRNLVARAFPDNDQNQALQCIEYLENHVDNLNERFIEFVREMPKLLNKGNLLNNYAKVQETDKLEDRNAAMTSVADLLGCPKLLARSTKMTLIVDGERKEGVFMEKAKGEDIADVHPDSPFHKLAKKDFATKELLEQVADLQIIDFICGNVDRHVANMMYQTTMVGKEAKVTGIVGIDNDSSFGTIDGNRTTINLPGVNQLKCINRRMYDRLKIITPEMLEVTLRQYHLDNKEIAAAKKRMKLVVKTVERENSPIRIIEEGAWNVTNMKDVVYKSEDQQRQNYFSMINDLPATWDKSKLCDANKDKLRNAQARFASLHEYYKMPDEKQFDEALGRIEDESKMRQDNFDQLMQLQHEANMATAFFGTEQYQKIVDFLTTVGTISQKTDESSELADWKKLENCYRKISEQTEKYLERKEKELAKKQLDGSDLSNTAWKRYLAMSNLKRFADRRIANIGRYIQAHKNDEIDLVTLKASTAKLERKLTGKPINAEIFAKWIAKKHVLDQIANNPKAGHTMGDEYHYCARLMSSEIFMNTVASLKNKVVPLDFAYHTLTYNFKLGDTSIEQVMDTSRSLAAKEAAKDTTKKVSKENPKEDLKEDPKKAPKEASGALEEKEGAPAAKDDEINSYVVF